MTHDPKCHAYGYGPGQRMDICICTGIRIGRADEREKALDWRVGVEVRQILEGQIYADLRTKVNELPAATVVAGVWHGSPPYEKEWDEPMVFRADVLALFDNDTIL